MKQPPPPTDDEVEQEDSLSPESGVRTDARPLMPEEKLWLACLLENAKRPSYFKTDHFIDTCRLLNIEPEYIKRKMQ